MSFLKKLEELLDKDSFTKVKKEVGDKDLIINDGSYIPKEKFNEKLNEIKELKEEKTSLNKKISEAEKELSTLKEEKNKGNKTVEEKIKDLTDQISELKNQNTLKDQKLEESKKENLLKDALTESGVKNPKNLRLLMKEFKLSELEIDSGGKIKGLDEKIKALQTDYKPLFGEEKIEGADPSGSRNKPNPETQKEVSTKEFYEDIFNPKK